MENAIVTSPLAEVANAITDKATILYNLNSQIPNTDIGLPEYIYRADLIPGDLNDSNFDLDTNTSVEYYTPEERSQILESAVVILDYSQGYPTFFDGEPFWSRMQHETPDAYRAFLAYLDLPRDKTYKVTHSDGSSNMQKVSSPVRQLHILKDIVSIDTATLLTYCHIYYWPQRTRAFDLFQVASHSKLKEQRLTKIEDEHFHKATRYIELADHFLEGVFADPGEHGLKPKEAMDLLIKMIQVQRVSVGAPAMGSAQKDPNALPQNASLEVVLRTIAQNAGVLKNANTEDNSVKALLEDPDSLAVAQELIIKMNNMTDDKRVFNALAETNKDAPK